jgi:threonine dehydratase
VIPRPARTVHAPSATELAEARQIIRATLAPTPLVATTVAGRRLWLKMEGFQPTGSFKVRGALAAIDDVLRREPGRAVVACSAGNHGLGVAWAATLLGVEACVVVPKTASPAKISKLKTYPIDLVLAGESFDDAETVALDLAEQRDARFVSPYNDTHVIAGQSSMAAEVIEQLPEADHLVVAVGGGGLAAGSALALALHPCRLHGAQVEQNAAFSQAFRGDAVDLGSLEPTIADGIAGGFEPGSVTLALLHQVDFDLTLVSEAATLDAIRQVLSDVGVVAEGSAGVAVAAALSRADEWGGEVVVAVSGHNIALPRLAEIVEDQTL